ncbi:MAG: tetratricopeptide repeat protein [Acidobacteriota bacterium]
MNRPAGSLLEWLYGLLALLLWGSSLLAQAPNDACQQGFSALQKNNATAAEPLLRKCLELRPNLIHSYLALCSIYQSQGNPEALYRTAALGLKRFPNEKRFYLTVGNHSGREENYEESVRVFEEAHRRWPDDSLFQEGLANAHLSWGIRLLDQNAEAEAEPHLRIAVKLADRDVEAHLNLGRALHNLNRSTEAVAEFDRVIALDPKAPLAWFHRGMVLQALGDLEPAIADLTREIQLNPDYPPSYLFRGRALMTRGQLEQALVDLNLAVQRMPANPNAVFARGRCHALLKQVKEAEADFRKTVELDPENPEPLNALGRLLWLEGKSEEGQALLQKALEKSQVIRSAKPGEIRFEGATPLRPKDAGTSGKK